VRVHDVDTLAFDETDQAPHRPRIPGCLHGQRQRLEPGIARPLDEPAVRLARQDDTPAAFASPPRLVQRADLLTTASAGRFRVEHRPHWPTAVLTSYSTSSGSMPVMQM